jgi:sugar lactone lactonase YvrE
MTGAGPELLVDGLGFGEGPRWRVDENGGRLFFSDFLQHTVFSLDPDDGAGLRVEAKLDDRPSGLGWLPDGRLLVVSMHDRRLLRREPDGSLVTHADLSGVATGPVNDMVVAADGTAYVGNFGSDLLAGEERRPARLAIVNPDGSVRAGDDDLMFPNGAVITGDGDLLVVGETLASRYTAFRIGADGSLGGGRVWASTPDRLPDGCSMDAEGAIWFADSRAPQVARVHEGGEITQVIDFPATCFACALGGIDGRTLFVLTCTAPPMPDLAVGGGRLWRVRVGIPKGDARP